MGNLNLVLNVLNYLAPGEVGWGEARPCIKEVAYWGVKRGFWFHLSCSGQNANASIHQNTVITVWDF